MGLFARLLGRSEPDTAPVSDADLQALYEDDALILQPEPVVPMPASAPIPAPAPMRVLEPDVSEASEVQDDVAAEDDTAQLEEPQLDDAPVMDQENAIVDTAIERSNSANIWDLDDDVPEEVPSAEEKTIAPGAASSARNLAATRARRNRTRLIGFDKSDGGVVDLFDGEPQKAATEKVQFPVGWLLVVEGPGRGHCFAIVAGMSQIGRGPDQTVQLDFGDTAISRNNHAAVVFDGETNGFMLGHGGKANIVRLNGKPVISNETLQDGDKIKIGDTTLQLKTLCGEDFNWSADDADGEEHEDVAIA